MVSAGRLDGRVALVTAAASGIGAASATRLAAEGATVVGTDVADEQGRDLAGRLPRGGGYQHLDVASADDWATVRAYVDRRFGRLDIVHSNAAYVVDKPAHQLTLEERNAQLAVSLTGAWLMVRTFIDLLRAVRGSIILTSSVLAQAGLPNRPAYAASQGALDSLARHLAVEYGPEVRVNTIRPGPIRTPAWDGDLYGPGDLGRTAGATRAG